MEFVKLLGEVSLDGRPNTGHAKGFEPEMEMFLEMQYEVTRSCTIVLAEFGVDSKEKEGRVGWEAVDEVRWIGNSRIRNKRIR